MVTQEIREVVVKQIFLRRYSSIVVVLIVFLPVNLLAQSSKYDFDNEILTIRERQPALFDNKSNVVYENFGPSNTNADILFAATIISDCDLDLLREKFPELSEKYRPIFVGDLDGDGECEILIDRSNVWGADITELVVFKKIIGAVSAYSIKIPRDLMTIRVEVNDSVKSITASKLSKKSIVDDNGLDKTIFVAERIVMRFTGSSLEVVIPLSVVN